MSILSFINFPREIIYLIYEYLKHEDIIYGFFQLNQSFQLSVKYFIGKKLHLNNEIYFEYCFNNYLPIFGYNLRYLSINYPSISMNYMKFIEFFCPNLDHITIHCYEDVRSYATCLIHSQLKSLILMFEKKIVGKDISYRLLNQYEKSYKIQSTSSIILHLSSLNDLILLKRYSESSYLNNGLYMIECISTGQWLTESKDDLCIMSMKLQRHCIFSIKEKYSREYEIFNEDTKHQLTVLIPTNEEYWISSSILSTQRKQSLYSCSTFTFEQIQDDHQYYIRPCYTNAKRLQISGKRIIVSLCDNENILNHSFKLYRIL